MATNPPKGDNHRQGAVKDRSQAYNPHTKRWTKIDEGTHLFMAMMAKKNTPFKGVRKK